jgi:hypothetical protein
MNKAIDDMIKDKDRWIKTLLYLERI